MKFEYFEVRPCIEVDGETTSYTSEGDFEAAFAALAADDAQPRTFWTLYGRYNPPASDGDQQFLAMAVGDFITKKDAHEVMNAILAPMAEARDMMEQASAALADFINQCSNMERI